MLHSLELFIFQLEEAFRKQQQAEEAARLAERERVEKERVEARKRKEVQRITDVSFTVFSCVITRIMFYQYFEKLHIAQERRREEERRRVQEPRLGREEVNGSDHHER